MDYTIILYIIFGVTPSLIWLGYYLTKDLQPEPKRIILKMFFWGALITIPVFFVQMGMTTVLGEIKINILVKNLIQWFVIIAFSEELFKYLPVRLRGIGSRHLDEPVDVMLYMVIVALGFAALENTLCTITPSGPSTPLSFDQLINRSIMIAIIRFVGATFLHTLCSAVVGYALAISFYEAKFKKTIVVVGLTVATLLHGFYDFSIMTLGGYIRLVIPAIILLTLAFLVFAGFERLKKKRGLCKIS